MTRKAIPAITGRARRDIEVGVMSEGTRSTVYKTEVAMVSVAEK